METNAKSFQVQTIKSNAIYNQEITLKHPKLRQTSTIIQIKQKDIFQALGYTIKDMIFPDYLKEIQPVLELPF